jgi:hypothetical protein
MIKRVVVQQRAESLRKLSEAIAGRRWSACSPLLYRVIYGLPSTVLLPMTAERIARMLPFYEKRWPDARWPRAVVENTHRWIAQFGRSVPDSPEPASVADARFVFSLDALLLGFSYSENAGVVASSCACAIREMVGLGVQLSAEKGGFEKDLAECDGCGTVKSAPNPDSPVEFARSREWQAVLDALLARKLPDYPDPESPEQLDADLALWENHDELLIVPGSTAVPNA